MKRAVKKPEPHTEKSTMTEPQEEFIEPEARPSRPAHPPESDDERKAREKQARKPKKE
ncbi:MAG: hypothetical protein NTZ46_05375 [Verrucomicrobia bacterium]|nr:hypothetical protein [Verrucomicrobiota bacterium]